MKAKIGIGGEIAAVEVVAIAASLFGGFAVFAAAQVAAKVEENRHEAEMKRLFNEKELKLAELARQIKAEKKPLRRSKAVNANQIERMFSSLTKTLKEALFEPIKTEDGPEEEVDVFSSRSGSGRGRTVSTFGKQIGGDSPAAPYRPTLGGGRVPEEEKAPSTLGFGRGMAPARPEDTDKRTLPGLQNGTRSNPFRRGGDE